MATCTFFGNSNAPDSIKPLLESVLKELIEHHEVNIFYVGNHGRFDNICRSVLKDLKMVYPQIYYSVVLAYMPGQRKSLDFRDYSDTIYPDGLERVPPKVAICARNDWMLSRSDFVVTYVCSITGGAATYKEKSLKKGKTVIELFKREI
ncbi:MAG: hypothetical protein IJC25_05825 [Clostridia bacterium]|nr:hypothetical protein [Clostridia bacterium]